MRTPEPPLAAPAPAAAGTRARLLGSALLLFRRHGYHGVGLAEILSRAGVPKGSLYHHFPGGKEQIAVEVIEQVAAGAVALIEQAAVQDGPALMRAVGREIARWMAHTGSGACAVLASFAAEGDTAGALRDAVAAAYERIAGALAARLARWGWPRPAALQRAYIAIALLEGGGLVGQAMRQSALFDAAILQAASLFDHPPATKRTTPRASPRSSR